MNFFLIKIDQFIGGYDPVETVHLIATDQPIQCEYIDLLAGLWIDKDKVVGGNYSVFFNGEVLCELSDIKEVDESTFFLLKGLGL